MFYVKLNGITILRDEDESKARLYAHDIINQIALKYARENMRDLIRATGKRVLAGKKDMYTIGMYVVEVTT